MFKTSLKHNILEVVVINFPFFLKYTVNRTKLLTFLHSWWLHKDQKWHKSYHRWGELPECLFSELTTLLVCLWYSSGLSTVLWSMSCQLTTAAITAHFSVIIKLAEVCSNYINTESSWVVFTQRLWWFARWRALICITSPSVIRFFAVFTPPNLLSFMVHTHYMSFSVSSPTCLRTLKDLWLYIIKQNQQHFLGFINVKEKLYSYKLM